MIHRDGGPGHLGAALLLDARETVERHVPRLARFFAQFADDRLGGIRHGFATVAEGVHLLLVGPHESAVAAAIGADLARCSDRLGFGALRWRLFHLPPERRALSEAIDAARGAPREEGASPVEGAARLEAALGGADPADLLREWPVHALAPDGDRIAFDDAELDVAAVAGASGIDVRGNPWLLERASALVERRALREAPDTARDRSRPVCVHIHSAFAGSAAFWPLIDALPVVAREKLILDFSAGDADANPGRVAGLLARLARAGVATALSQISWHKPDAVAGIAGPVAWLKGRFDPAAPPGAALLKFGAARCVAVDLPRPEDAAAAADAGFERISGPGADAFAAARRTRLLLGARTPGVKRAGSEKR